MLLHSTLPRDATLSYSIALYHLFSPEADIAGGRVMLQEAVSCCRRLCHVAGGRVTERGTHSFGYLRTHPE